ncbi:MAG TPA: efflux RND transporter periplasmic adaptor subunit [Vicinamibacterales bacterium]|jgi:RND family efflux transporter MFP subunit|nr:efflux RND transporter periplasmic adaptor subunit [Vicinamibacterales bacterium]
MKRLMGIVALGLIAALVSACRTSPHAAVAAHPQEPIAVTIAAASMTDTADRLEAGGVVTARETAVISSRITATIARIAVAAGDRVRAGDVLLTLDAQDVVERAQQARALARAAEKTLVQTKAEEKAAEAEETLAAAWQGRIVTLHERRAATDQERDEANARLAAADARISAARAGADAADAQLAAARAAADAATAAEAFAIVRAPFDGLVAERLIDPGNLALPGVPLLRLESAGDRQIVAHVDEARAAFVRVGDRVTVALADMPSSDRAVDAVVAEVARAVDVDQRAFTVKIDLASPVHVRSGSFARVVFAGARRRALVVPADAVRRRGQVSSLFVVQDGVARLRLIDVGAMLSGGVEVLAGLDAGESVVTSPPPRLVDGSSVVVGHTGGAS